MDLNIICHRVHKVTSRCASICGFSILVTTLCMLNLTRVLFKPAKYMQTKSNNSTFDDAQTDCIADAHAL